MKLLKGFVSALGYLAEGSLEIFSPNHDSYPVVGLQPYSGEAYHPSKKSRHLQPVAKMAKP